MIWYNKLLFQIISYASIPLDYLESRPEDHFQIVNYGAPFAYDLK